MPAERQPGRIGSWRVRRAEDRRTSLNNSMGGLEAAAQVRRERIAARRRSEGAGRQVRTERGSIDLFTGRGTGSTAPAPRVKRQNESHTEAEPVNYHYEYPGMSDIARDANWYAWAGNVLAEPHVKGGEKGEALLGRSIEAIERKIVRDDNERRERIRRENGEDAEPAPTRFRVYGIPPEGYRPYGSTTPDENDGPDDEPTPPPSPRPTSPRSPSNPSAAQTAGDTQPPDDGGPVETTEPTLQEARKFFEAQLTNYRQKIAHEKPGTKEYLVSRLFIRNLEKELENINAQPGHSSPKTTTSSEDEPSASRSKKTQPDEEAEIPKPPKKPPKTERLTERDLIRARAQQILSEHLGQSPEDYARTLLTRRPTDFVRSRSRNNYERVTTRTDTQPTPAELAVRAEVEVMRKQGLSDQTIKKTLVKKYHPDLSGKAKDPEMLEKFLATRKLFFNKKITPGRSE